MTYNVYAVRDNKTSFTQLWYDYGDESAKRGFSMMMNNPQGIMAFSPRDFDLFKVGTFDSETGQIVSVWPIEYMMSGVAAVMPNLKQFSEVDEDEKS